jgi:hemerythrin
MGVSWTDDLETGDKTIDDQHRLLFKAVGDLMDAMWQGKGSGEVQHLLGLLSEYVGKHFFDEEVFMRVNGYPDYEQHKRIHDAFAEEISGLNRKFVDGGTTTALVVEVLDKSCDWLRNHISKVDQQMVRQIRNKS